MELHLPVKVYSEPGCVKRHGTELCALGTKAMIVTGRHSAVKTGALQDVKDALGQIPCVVFDEIEENPSVETVVKAAELAKAQKVDFVIGIGGGSPMDASKAIALLAANPDETEEIFYEIRKLPHLPVVCVPTTCGTGSEVTPYAVLTRHKLRTKKSISHRIFPELALLDAGYLRTMSREGLVNTCVDALAHLLESWLNLGSNDLNRSYTREGLRLWGSFRNRLLEDMVRPEDYESMLHASMYAGMAISHTGTSLPHGLSYCITYEEGMPHGRAVGMFLGGFVEGYADQAEAKEAVRLLGFDSPTDFRVYMNRLLGKVPVSEELLQTTVKALLVDPSKLKNYPGSLTETELTAMVN